MVAQFWNFRIKLLALMTVFVVAVSYLALTQRIHLRSREYAVVSSIPEGTEWRIFNGREPGSILLLLSSAESKMIYTVKTQSGEVLLPNCSNYLICDVFLIRIHDDQEGVVLGSPKTDMEPDYVGSGDQIQFTGLQKQRITIKYSHP